MKVLKIKSFWRVIICAVALFGLSPLFLTSCEPEPAVIKVTVETDMSPIVEAIKSTNTTLSAKLRFL